MGDVPGVPAALVAKEDILSRIILTVESITEKFEGIKGELGETGQKYDKLREELSLDIQSLKDDMNGIRESVLQWKESKIDRSAIEKKICELEEKYEEISAELAGIRKKRMCSIM
jgi:hypothetical protein